MPYPRSFPRISYAVTCAKCRLKLRVKCGALSDEEIANYECSDCYRKRIEAEKESQWTLKI